MHGHEITDEAAAVARLLELTDPANGDDAAVLAIGAGVACASTDSTIAGVHAPASAPPGVLGRHAVARAASDLAAMGAAPLAMTCAVHVPRGCWPEAVAAVEGAAARGREQGLRLVGGDLSSTSGPLALVVTVIGRRGAPRTGFVARRGARAGDVVVVTGALGRAAAAHARDPNGPPPEPPDRIRAGLLLGRVAHAMVDLSDGLVRDAGHVARASGVALEVDVSALPVAEGVDPLTAASFGDDYELLACVAEERLPFLRERAARIDPSIGLTRIGRAVDGPAGVRLLDGDRLLEPPCGFVHR